MKYYDLISDFKKLVKKAQELEKKAWDSGDGDKLYSSELRVIYLIGQNDAINITELAKKYVATKGALSKFVNKLRRKGYVDKFRYYDNDKEVLLKLTEKGKKVYEKYKLKHSQMSSDLLKYVKSLTDTELHTLKGFFEQMENAYDRHF